MMKAVAVTGGIGSGKSVVCAHLQRCGVPVYDSDSRTNTLYDRCPGLIEEVEEAFGMCFRDGDGRLDRRALAAVAFADRVALERLESIVHPKVLEDFIDWRDSYPGQGWRGYAGAEPFVVMESAIILSKPAFLSQVDAVVLVTAPLERRIDRAVRRDACPREDIIARMASQETVEDGVDALIINDSDLETLYRRTDSAFSGLFKIIR